MFAPTRLITVLGIIQVAVIIIAFFALGAVMKADGYPASSRWDEFPIFLRQYGMFLLLLPVVWAAVCADTEHRHPERDFSVLILFSGLFIVVTILVVFYCAATTPGHGGPMQNS